MTWNLRPSDDSTIISSAASTVDTEGKKMSKRVVTVQQTGKLWKLLQLVGVVILLGGVIWLFVGLANRNDEMTTAQMSEATINSLWAAGVIFLGLFLLATGRIFGWWFHG